jgi:tRNA-intron endonuclease
MVLDERDEESKKAIVGLLSEGKILVNLKNNPQAESLIAKGYGEKIKKGFLELAGWEALYLVSQELLEVSDEKGRKLEFNELLSCLSKVDEAIWSKYVVFRDLRSRGYVVKPGFGYGFHFRVYERGAFGRETSKFLVLIVKEGEPIPLWHLTKALESAKNAKKEVLVGVIERRGEVVYYTISQFA